MDNFKISKRTEYSEYTRKLLRLPLWGVFTYKKGTRLISLRFVKNTKNFAFTVDILSKKLIKTNCTLFAI